MIGAKLKKYVFAFFEVAKKENNFSDLQESIKLFTVEFLKVKPLIEKLHLQSLDKEKQVEILSVILQAIKANKLFVDFVNILIDRGEITLLEKFLLNWEQLRKEFEGYERIEIITAEPLLEEQENAIKDQLQKVLGTKFFIEKKVDENIIAGLIVRGKDFEFNDSILGKLNHISKNIKGALFNE